MNFFDYVKQAFRNVGRSKLRSALTIFAVVIGATSVTIMLALVFGAKNFFTSQFEANGTLQQVAVTPKADLSNFGDAGHGGNNNCDTCIKLSEALIKKIVAMPHVVGLARHASAGAFEAVMYNDKKLTLNNIQASDTNGIVVNTMLAGRDIDASDTTGTITITSDYADKFGFKNNYKGMLGKQVSLISRSWYNGVGATVPMPQQGPGNNNNNGQNSQPPTTLMATVVGVEDSSNESATVHTSLAWVRGMNEMQMYQQTAADQAANDAANRNLRPGQQPTQTHFTLVTTDQLALNGYDSLTVKVDATNNAAGVADNIKKLGVGAADAETYIKSQLAIFNIIGLVLGGIGAIALLVAAIGVINTMVMATLERTREIGIMRACGAQRKVIRRLFTFEASVLGFWGGVIGVAIGYGLTFVANHFINAQLNGNGVLAHNIINLPLWLIGVVILTTTVIGMLSGLYPAIRAARLSPIDALRYE